MHIKETKDASNGNQRVLMVDERWLVGENEDGRWRVMDTRLCKRVGEIHTVSQLAELIFSIRGEEIECECNLVYGKLKRMSPIILDAWTTSRVCLYLGVSVSKFCELRRDGFFPEPDGANHSGVSIWEVRKVMDWAIENRKK